MNRNVESVTFYLKCTNSAFPGSDLSAVIHRLHSEFVPPILLQKKSTMFIQEGCLNTFVGDKELMDLLANMQLTAIYGLHERKKNGIPFHDVKWHID